MDLGRLLRAEGITPAMIEQNRELLVRAMKSSLDEGFSPAQSYRTAPQSFEDDYDRMGNAQSQQSMAKSSTWASTGLLGSAPVLRATFSRAFLERNNGAARSLDKEQNVQKGMKSLLKGMDTEEQADIGKDEEGEAIRHARHVSYLLKAVPKSCRACSAVYARRHNGTKMQQGSFALINRNAMNSRVDRISERWNRYRLFKEHSCHNRSYLACLRN